MSRKRKSTTESSAPQADARPPKRRPGCWKGKMWIADDFDDQLPEEILKTFNEAPIEPPA